MLSTKIIKIKIKIIVVDVQINHQFYHYFLLIPHLLCLKHKKDGFHLSIPFSQFEKKELIFFINNLLTFKKINRY